MAKKRHKGTAFIVATDEYAFKHQMVACRKAIFGKNNSLMKELEESGQLKNENKKGPPMAALLKDGFAN
ncbi:MAG: hypothetical protein GC193_02095 [Cryomorphaceae bacterium]|nr:hypothetical protein [Cryomorphaceae bacterium]